MPNKIGSGIATVDYGTKDETWGLCETREEEQTSEKKEVKNGDNDTIGVIYSDKKRKVTGTYELLTPGPANVSDLVGKQLELENGDSILVDSCKLTSKRGENKTFSFDGTIYPNVVVS